MIRKAKIKLNIIKNRSGFLPQRQFRDNTWTVLNILEYLEKYDEKWIAWILNAEKAFDNLNELFVFKVSEDMDFGEMLWNG